MKEIIFILLASILLVSCENPKKVGETKLNPNSNPELKYVGFQKLSDFLYLTKNFETKTTFDNDTLNSPFFEVSPKQGNYYEIYSRDSIFSGFVQKGYLKYGIGTQDYSEYFTSNKLTQKEIDDYNLEQLLNVKKFE